MSNHQKATSRHEDPLERRGQRYQHILVWAERHHWGLVAGIGGGVVVVIPIVYVRAVLWLLELRAMG